MITDLFVVTSGLDAGTVARAIPPACRREASARPVATVRQDELLLEFGEWRPRVPARHLVPSFSMLTEVPYAARVELSAWAGGTWSPWIASVTWGAFRRTGGASEGSPSPADVRGTPADPGYPSTAVERSSTTRGDALVCDVDVYTAAMPCERLRLRIRVGTADSRALVAAPWIATLSASDLAPPAPATIAVSTPRLPVPALSQMQAPPEIARRICSPTSVAMVLTYWGAPTAAVPLAEEMFHAGTDCYGVWPAALLAAGRRGVAGYLLRFPDWPSAAWCLERGIPIIASVRYAAGELTGAPLPETSGHLIVLTGCDHEHVFVNDPVAPTRAEVPRRYRLAELERVWLDRTGVGYVLFRPDRLGESK
jgi:hypothetical protein